MPPAASQVLERTAPTRPRARSAPAPARGRRRSRVCCPCRLARPHRAGTYTVRHSCSEQTGWLCRSRTGTRHRRAGARANAYRHALPAAKKRHGAATSVLRATVTCGATRSSTSRTIGIGMNVVNIRHPSCPTPASLTALGALPLTPAPAHARSRSRPLPLTPAPAYARSRSGSFSLSPLPLRPIPTPSEGLACTDLARQRRAGSGRGKRRE